MYYWVASYTHKGKGFSASGLFNYEDPEDAKYEAELLADKKLYKFNHGVPMNAALTSVGIYYQVH